MLALEVGHIRNALLISLTRRTGIGGQPELPLKGAPHDFVRYITESHDDGPHHYCG